MLLSLVVSGSDQVRLFKDSPRATFQIFRWLVGLGLGGTNRVSALQMQQEAVIEGE